MAKMESATPPLRKQIEASLRKFGYTSSFVRDFMPDWWTAEAEADPGALDQLKLSLSRSLGLDFPALRNNEIKPVAPGTMEFYRSANLEDAQPPDLNLAFFATIIEAISAAIPTSMVLPRDPLQMRQEILQESGARYVSLESILNYCHRRNIAVIHVDTIPGGKKGCDALAYRFSGRDVIIVARTINLNEPGRASFFIAHELGHIALGDVRENSVLVDESVGKETSNKEQIANDFAGTVLGGEYDPTWAGSLLQPQSLARRAIVVGNERGADATHLLLRWGKDNQKHPLANRALSLLPAKHAEPARKTINRMASTMIDYSQLGREMGSMLRFTLEREEDAPAAAKRVLKRKPSARATTKKPQHSKMSPVPRRSAG